MDNFHDPNRLTACQLYYDCMSGDRERQNRGYENLGRYLYKPALSLTDTFKDAQDLAQITLEKVYKNIGQVRSCKAFKSWSRTILHNEFFRKWDKEPKEEELSENVSDKSSDESPFQRVESPGELIDRLFNASLGRKARWAWIGRYYYGVPSDRDLAAIENLLCDTSVGESTYPSIRAKTKMRWIDMGLVDLWKQAEFWPADPTKDDALDPKNGDHVALQESLQQLLITDEWCLLYEARLGKGACWAWIGLYIYEMSDEDLARVENLLCKSAIDSRVMSERRKNTWETLSTYLSEL